MESRHRTNRYSMQNVQVAQNRLSLQFTRLHLGSDRVNKLSQLSMSNYLVCHAKLKKRHKVKGGQLASASNLAYIPDDDPSRLVVSDTKAGRIMVYREGSKIGKQLPLDIQQPQGVACLDSRTIVVVDGDVNGQVKVISIGDDVNMTSNIVNEWGNDSGTWQPRGVAVTRNGQIVVTNIHPEASERFRLYSSEGNEVMSFGRAQGPADLVFCSPYYVTVDDVGRILATDKTGNCVKMFDTRGRYIGEFGKGSASAAPNTSTTAEKSSNLSNPMGIVCDNRGNIIVCDSGNRRLTMFSQDGCFLQELRSPQKPGLCPVGVAINSTGDHLALSVHDRTSAFKKMVLYNYVCT